MKRLISFALLCCLFLCACGQPTTPTEPSPRTQPATESTTQLATEPTTESIPATQASTKATTKPTQPKAKKVTVYLLTKATYFDSGYVEYNYDENHNIDSYTVFTIENTTMSQVFFEKKDANGMACVIRTQFPEDISNETRNLTYFKDGKLKEEQIAGSNYSGYQYEYNQKGNRTEKREYYDGILQSVVYYEYDGGQLKAAYCENNADNKIFECRIKNGLIVEKVFFDSDKEYGYLYEYDENNNLIKTTFCQDGESIPGDQYFYKAVKVNAERAHYLKEQQKYLIPVA